jgi:hypothetical protein
MSVYSLKDLGDSLGFNVENGLIQNDKPISWEDAKNINERLILRWRFRVCRKTGEFFDITKQGFGYEVE